MVLIHTVFDCNHEQDLEVQVDDDVVIPERVRGLGKCPTCTGEENVVPVSGVAPQADGSLVVDSVLMIQI